MESGGKMQFPWKWGDSLSVPSLENTRLQETDQGYVGDTEVKGFSLPLQKTGKLCITTNLLPNGWGKRQGQAYDKVLPQ